MFLNKNIIKKNAENLKAFFLDLLFPVECLGCGKEGTLFCGECFKKIKFEDSGYCLSCKKENRLGEFCADCGKDYFLDGVWVAGNYDDELTNALVKNFKYRFVRELSGVLGRFLALFLRDLINKNRLINSDLSRGNIWRRLEEIKGSPSIFLNFKDCLLVPIPLHKKRLRWRGFNQGEIIARELIKYFDLEINVDKLIRIKHAKAQAGLGKEKRKSNVKNCFVWNAENLEGRNVILVDDVVTTGSTLNECAKVLKENGAREVWGLVLARG